MPLEEGETYAEEKSRRHRELNEHTKEIARRSSHPLLRKPTVSPWVQRNLAKEQHSHEIESHE